MTKEIRDFCLTVGTVSLVTVSALFLFTLVTSLKLGKLALLIMIASVALILFGMSQKNRNRLKALVAVRSLP